MMKACVVRQYGQPDEVVQVEDDFPRPDVGSNKNDVLIRVHASAINPIDRKLAAGDMSLVVPLKLPRVIGFDVSGVVEEVGSAVTRFKAGDEVYGMSSIFLGTFAEYARVPQNNLAIRSPALTHVQSAAIPLAGLTSYQALVKYGQMKPGQRVLVLGGSGGTGTYGIQIAKALGASHVATTSTNEDLVRSLGADEVVNYREANFAEVLAGQNFDIVYDCVGGRDAWEGAQRVLKPSGGRFVTIVGDSEGKLSVGKLLRSGSSIANRKFWSVFKYPSYDLFTTNAAAPDDLVAMATMADEGKLTPVMDPESPYPFTPAGVRAMVQKSMSHRAKGKLVLDIAGDHVAAVAEPVAEEEQ